MLTNDEVAAAFRRIREEHITVPDDGLVLTRFPSGRPWERIVKDSVWGWLHEICLDDDPKPCVLGT